MVIVILFMRQNAAQITDPGDLLLGNIHLGICVRMGNVHHYSSEQ